MASTGLTFICAIAALVFWALVGLPIARKLLAPTLALPAAPALGWAVHSALALPLYRTIGFTTLTVTVCSIMVVIGACALLIRPAKPERGAIAPSAVAYGLAALLAIVSVAAILPKISGDAVTLAPAIFDHSKVALVNEMARLGLPPGNPFFGEAGKPFAYYYLWHFSAAELALAFGISGWEADAALTGVTGFFSLSLMIGLATWLGGRAAGLWVVPLAFAGSLRTVLEFMLGTEAFESILQRQTGLAGWLFQTTWAPQHAASATCVLIACVLIAQLGRRPSVLLALPLGLVVAAGYQSSVWIGGLLFAAAAPLIALVLLLDEKTDRRRFVAWCAAAACLALIFVYPFLRDQIANAGARGPGSPIVFYQYEVFSVWIPESARRLLDFPGYWLVFLIVEFPAIYLPGLVSLAFVLRSKTRDWRAHGTAKALAIVAATGLIVAGYVTITFSDNNDLGWRAALPAIFVLIVFAAVGLSRWLTQRAAMPAAAKLVLLALAIPKSLELAGEHFQGTPTESDRVFAATPTLWEAVRRHAGPADRVGNNPFFLEMMTPWSINISWALLANRRSCFAGNDYMAPFTTVSRSQMAHIETQFRRVFAGQPEAGDIGELVTHYRCRVVVLTPQDGAWQRDPFAKSKLYSLVEQGAEWKIYRATDAVWPPA